MPNTFVVHIVPRDAWENRGVCNFSATKVRNV